MTTVERLQAILMRDFDLSPEMLQPAARLEELEIDSLSILEIMFAVEDEFKIVVPAELAELQGRMTTVGDLFAYVDRLVAEPQAPAARGQVVS